MGWGGPARAVLVAAAASGGLAGCSGGFESDNDFAAARAEAECRNLERCSLGFFESEYGDYEDCVNEVTDDLEDSNAQLDDADCTYDPAEAGRCVSRVRALSCEEWYQGDDGRACDLVWVCDFTGYYQ